MKISHKFIFILLVVAAMAASAASVSAQRRDYMTEQEIELVRDAQDIDKRIEVLTKMIDRRFTALGIDTGGWKASAKDQATWGELRTGTAAQHLYDIRQLLQKAIDDIDDVAEHNENTLTQNKTEGLLFPVAVRNLGAAATRYLPALKSTLAKTSDNRDKGLILTSIESCEAIIEAVAKLPPPPTKAEKKKAKS